MNRQPTTWIIKEKIPEKISDDLRKYPNLIRQILYNRGIRTLQEADDFLRANSPEYSPHALKDMKKAVQIIYQSILDKKKIIVFGDYDVDGITSSVILVQLLQKYRADVDVFIPNRFDEGYGLSFDAIASVREKHPDLIITVDCGVRSAKEVKFLKDEGISIVITDHHQPHQYIPDADAVICPKQPSDNYPDKHLAGVGIAYKLAKGMLKAHPIDGVDANDWIDLVAVGTIADLAPLDDENRALVRRGLRRIRLAQNRGLLALSNVSGTNIQQIASEDIGFRIGPRLNAAGRLDSANLAYRLLMAKTTREAGELALELDQKNRKRQIITHDIEQCALEKYDPNTHKHFLFFWDDSFHEGVVGLAASRLVEKFYRPAIVGVQNDGIVRASCRSIEGFNIISALDRCEEYLVQHGGHAMAAGLSINVEQIKEFCMAFNSVCEEMITKDMLIRKLTAVAEITFRDLKPKNLSYYDLLEPLGTNNPIPLFVTRDVRIKRIKKIGKEYKHLKMTLTDGNLDFTTLAWRFGDYYDTLKRAEKLDILYAYETNTYQGSVKLQLRLVDFRISAD